MSQNSLVLPTTGTVSGLQMTQNVNYALDTLNTLNSGASAPSVIEAGMLWHDTTNNILKVRSLDNTSWISLFTFNETAYTCGLTNALISLASGSTATTQTAGDSSTKVATTAFVNGTALTIANGSTATTQTSSDSSTKLATTAFVQTVLGGSGVTYNAITGLLPTSQTFTSSTVASMTISAGQAADSSNVAYISGGSYTWNITNGNAANGYQGGTTLPSSSTVHFFVCKGGSGTCSFASTSLTPTLPTGYSSYYRRIFSLPTNSSGVLLAGAPIESEGGALLYWLGTQVMDINTTTLGTTRTFYPVSVPSGIKVQWLGRYDGPLSASQYVILTSGDEADVAPNANANAFTAAPGYDQGNGGSFISYFGKPFLTTNTSGQVAARANAASTNLQLVTSGFKDFRRS